MKNLAASNSIRDFWLKVEPEKYLSMLETHSDEVFRKCWTADQTEAIELDSHTIENTIARAALVMGVVDNTMRSVDLLPKEADSEAEDS